MSFVDGTELGQDGILALAQRALELRAGSKAHRSDGARVAGVFLNPSLRTKTSLEAACGAVGAQPLMIMPGKDAWALELEDKVMDGDKAEHIREAAAVLSEFADLLAVRAFAKLESAEEDRADPVVSAFDRYSSVPVINLESALWHPLQGLADTATWVNHLGPDLRGKRITLTWAPHPKALPAAVPNQVLLSAALQGMDVTLAHPEGFDLDPQIVERAAAMASSGGGSVRTSQNQREAMAGAEVVVAKSWSGFAGYGRRDEEAVQRAEHRDWTVTSDKLPKGGGFMHCLPVRRGVVVAPEVLDGPQSWVVEEAGNRLWTAIALLERMLETS
ncbi:MAG: N-acetylornithine carbamoyltransferase [Proteobacteria bacterium]|nr:N-acetylornithine carbamoyltransferase [Pseudomonadota bacterium]